MDPNLFHGLVFAWIATGLITLLMLLYFNIRAPYGRHASTSWGNMIDNHWGWFWMEMPALLVMPAMAWSGPSEKNAHLWLLTGLWLLHYIYRTLIFPFQLRTRGKKMPVLIVGSAVFFNLINGGLNGYYLGFLEMENELQLSWHLIGGLFLFFGGMYINRSADRRLIALRKAGNGYRIPRGWWFEYISCPNHFGEIIEWTGFALVAWNLPAASFAIWTFCNLAPRALNHHAWYREHFSGYPEKRRAVIPFLW